MFHSVVEMYGIPQNITPENKVEVELQDEARLSDVITALKCKIPAMEGTVFQKGQNRLTDFYSFVVNGQFQLIDNNIRVQKGDRVVLVLLVIGG